jgi:hypothetical protein
MGLRGRSCVYPTETTRINTAVSSIRLRSEGIESVGRRLRIRAGSLDSVEGILELQGADQSLVVSVELLHRSISIRVEGYDIELVS